MQKVLMCPLCKFDVVIQNTKCTISRALKFNKQPHHMAGQNKNLLNKHEQKSDNNFKNLV